MVSNEIGVNAMQVSERFIADRADIPQGTDGRQQPQKASSVSLEILKRLDYWHPCEVPTLLNLALSHVIAYLLHQDEKPFEAPAEPFQRCFSRVPVIRYLASQQLLIPLLKRVPETLSMSKLKLSEFLNPEECLKLLQTFGKNLSRLYFYRSALSIENLAKLAPNLTDIEVNGPLTADELRQLMNHYPNIRRIGSTALRGIDSATLRELLQTCTALTDLNYVPPHDMPTEHISLKDISSSSLRKLRISNVVEDAFGFITRCPNLTSLAITNIDVNDPLRSTLQQCSKLTELSLPVNIKTDKMKTDDPNEGPATPNFTTFDNISKVTGNVALIQKCFSVTFPNAEIWMKLLGIEPQFTKTFFETKQNVRWISYVKFFSHNKANFQRCLEFSGSALESIDLGWSAGAASDIEIDGIITHCKKLERFACVRPAFENAALISLFKAIVLKKVEILDTENCNDRVVQSLLGKSGKSLVHLKIQHCPITNESLRIIAQLGSGLKKLILLGCDQILGADLVQLVLWTPNLKVAGFGNLSNDDVAQISQGLPNLRRVAFFVNDLFDIEKGWKCFSDDIVIELFNNRTLIFQNEKANTKNPRNQKLKNGFVSFNDSRNRIFFRGYMKNGFFHHGKGKLIMTDGSTYEGDFQDGRPQGKGKLIMADGSTYEGDFQDGKFHGKGKLIVVSGETYEGDFQDGLPHGKGKNIMPNRATYEGDWQNGKEHGKGKLIMADGSTYEGDFQDRKPQGKGKSIMPNGATYEGDHQDGKFHGKGKFMINGETYEGDYQDGKSHGKGKLIAVNGETYEGDWQNGMPHGKGKLIMPNGATYEGDWQNGMKHGFGTQTLPDGSAYEVEFVNNMFVKILSRNTEAIAWEKQFFDVKREGKKSEEAESKGQKTSRSEMREETEKPAGNPYGRKHGKGKYNWANGKTYEGDFQDGKFHGKGKLIKPNGEAYEGEWQNGIKHGKGKYTWADGDSYEGDFQDGKFHGKGKYTWSNVKTYEGEWQNGMLHGFGILTFPDGRAYEVEHINDKLVKSLPCNPDGSDLKKQLIEGKGEGKKSEKSEEAESKGQKTSCSETREEEEKPDGHPLKKRSRAEQETRKGQKTPRDFVNEDEETILLQKRSRNE